MPYEMLGEEFPQVLARAVAGDADAFTRLWRATHPALLRYLRVRAGGRAEDLAAETWLKVVERLPTFRGDEQGFRAWLVTIARHLHVDAVRRAARRPEAPTGEPLLLDAGPVAPDPAEEVLDRLSTEAALRLVATLPAEQAEMVTLRVVVGLDVAQVAALVGRRPGTVRVAVHRGLRRLAAVLAREAGPPVAGAAVTPAGVAAFRHRDA